MTGPWTPGGTGVLPEPVASTGSSPAGVPPGGSPAAVPAAAVPGGGGGTDRTTGAGPDLDADELDELDELDDLADEDLDGVPGMHVLRNLGQVAGVVQGDMHYVTNVYRQVRRLREYHELSGEYLTRFRQGFVERAYRAVDGSHLDSAGAAGLFPAYRCLVLLGVADSGRHTAAVGLLDRLGLPLREIGGWEPGQGEHFNPADLPAEPDHGYLLELPETPGDDVGRHLRSYRDTLRELGSYLVVVTTEEAWTAAGGYLDGGVLRVSRPNSRALLACEMRLLAPGRDLGALATDPALTDLLPDAAPRQVARLAQLLAAASAGTGDQHEIVASAVSAYKNWDSELATWFQGHTDVRERLFLVAAAVLEGCHGGLILRCAEELGERLGGPPPRAGIGEAGIRELARNAGGCVADDGTVRFARPAYSSAVIGFVCADRSDAFRTLLWDWAARLPLGAHPGRPAAVLADRVGEVLLEAITRQRDPRPLRRFINAWAPRLDLRPVVVELLTAAALSPETGAGVRALLNRWSVRGTGPDLVRVIAEVCRGDLADAYPRVALTRLNHLAATPSAEAAPAVVDAVADLWTRPQHRRAVLHRIVGWLAEPGTPPFAVACRLLLALTTTVDPRATIVGVALADPADREALAAGIGRILAEQDPPAEAIGAITEWLSLAAGEPALVEPLIGLLVAAVRGRAPARRIARIRSIAYRWQSTPDDLAPTRRWLCQRLVERLSTTDPLVNHQRVEDLREDRGRSWQG